MSKAFNTLSLQTSSRSVVFLSPRDRRWSSTTMSECRYARLRNLQPVFCIVILSEAVFIVMIYSISISVYHHTLHQLCNCSWYRLRLCRGELWAVKTRSSGSNLDRSRRTFRLTVGRFQPPIQCSAGYLLLGKKRPGLKSEYALQSTDNVKNEWSYTSTLIYGFMPCTGTSLRFTPEPRFRRLVSLPLSGVKFIPFVYVYDKVFTNGISKFLLCSWLYCVSTYVY
jgi:hypothetical protein